MITFISNNGFTLVQKIDVNDYRSVSGCCGSMLVSNKNYNKYNTGITITTDIDRECEDSSTYWEEKVELSAGEFLFIKHRKVYSEDGEDE